MDLTNMGTAQNLSVVVTSGGVAGYLGFMLRSLRASLEQ